MPTRSNRLTRLFGVLATGALVWSIFVTLTGGFVIHVSSIRISSRNVRNPLVLVIVSACTAFALATADERRRAWERVWATLRIVWSRIERLPSVLGPISAGLAAATVMGLALVYGARAAGGADDYAYVSQAEFWTEGDLHLEQPWAERLDWSYNIEAFTPLGYRPTPDRRALVPVYSPGYPLVMALFQKIGGRGAVFYVVPLLGGLLVWSTYLLGVRLAGRAVGASAAVLMATSPPFLFQIMLPMSDVPASAWWALALALVWSERLPAIGVSGLAAGLAILTRPNLVFVAIVPLLFLVWRALAGRSLRASAVKRLVLFCVCTAAGCIAVALINAHLYGSPLVSGYGRMENLYHASNFWPNATKYFRWFLEAHTPFALVALLAPFIPLGLRHEERLGRPRMTRAVVLTLACFILAILASYLWFDQFDTWIFLRYLMPAFAPLFVLAMLVVHAMVRRAPRGVAILVVACSVGVVGWRNAAFARDQHAFAFRELESKFSRVGEYIVSTLPSNAIFLSMQHSGSIRYYSGRLTVRYDQIPPKLLETSLRDLRRAGYHPYFLLEDWEEPWFREQFSAASPLGRLDWPPTADLRYVTRIRIYDPAARSEPDMPDIPDIPDMPDRPDRSSVSTN